MSTNIINLMNSGVFLNEILCNHLKSHSSPYISTYEKMYYQLKKNQVIEQHACYYDSI